MPLAAYHINTKWTILAAQKTVHYIESKRYFDQKANTMFCYDMFDYIADNDVNNVNNLRNHVKML